MASVMPCLWFDNNAEEAMNYYISTFRNSRVISNTPMVVTFEIEGQRLMGLNGGPQFKFNEAISLKVDCDSQEEVDRLWHKLVSDGGEEGRCGWLKDKFGLSWQIIPIEMVSYFGGADAEASQRAIQAMREMNKIDLAIIKKAYEGAL